MVNMPTPGKTRFFKVSVPTLSALINRIFEFINAFCPLLPHNLSCLSYLSDVAILNVKLESMIYDNTISCKSYCNCSWRCLKNLTTTKSTSRRPYELTVGQRLKLQTTSGSLRFSVQRFLFGVYVVVRLYFIIYFDFICYNVGF